MKAKSENLHAFFFSENETLLRPVLSAESNEVPVEAEGEEEEWVGELGGFCFQLLDEIGGLVLVV